MEDEAQRPSGGSLGPTLIGGLVGAAIGIGLHLALEVGANYEAPWFAVITGLATGLGVRAATKNSWPPVSYARGALTSLIALAAIVATYPLISMALDMKSKTDANKPSTDVAQAKGDAADEAADEEANAEAAEGEAAEGEAAEDEPAAAAPAKAAPAAASGAAKPKMPLGRGDFNVNQFIFMVLGALVAYPLGRGSDPTARPMREEPVAMDPSN
jgi:hypothetical protein